MNSLHTLSEKIGPFPFYHPLEKHFEAFGIPDFLHDGFEDEHYQRLKIFHEVCGGKTINKDKLMESFKYSSDKHTCQH